MVAPRKYPDELRERATRMAIEARKDPGSRASAVRRIADQLGVHPEALRTWVKCAETGEGLRPGTTSEDAARIAELDRLDHLRTVLAGEGHDTAHAHLAVFSEHGFTRDLVTTAARRPGVHLVDLAQLHGRN